MGRNHSKFQLMNAFFNMEIVGLFDSNGRLHRGAISSIQLEDGSGSSFNITMTNGDKFHLRTID
jgi:hypothetical protein